MHEPEIIDKIPHSTYVQIKMRREVCFLHLAVAVSPFLFSFFTINLFVNVWRT